MCVGDVLRVGGHQNNPTFTRFALHWLLNYSRDGGDENTITYYYCALISIILYGFLIPNSCMSLFTA